MRIRIKTRRGRKRRDEEENGRKGEGKERKTGREEEGGEKKQRQPKKLSV